MIDFDNGAVEVTNNAPLARIKVLGVGGAGCNMVHSMLKEGYEHVDFAVLNTDAQVLSKSEATHKIQLGAKSTKGLGAGASPERGRKAAEEDLDKVLDFIGDADIVFLAGGLGGGTGSGAMPVIAQALREKDILSVGIVTKPFTFEGRRRMNVAKIAIEEINENIDTLIVLPNQNLIDVVDTNVSLMDAFSMVNTILSRFVSSLYDIITKPGQMNVDFADIKAIMKNQGYALIGSSKASGENRAQKAALEAISSPLLDNVKIKGARGVLLNISGNSSLGLHEMSEAASIIYEQAHEEASIVLGSVIDESLEDEVSVTIIATGFDHNDQIDIQKEAQETAKVHGEQSIHTQEELKDNSESVQHTNAEARQQGNNKNKDNSENEFDNNNLDIPAIMRRKAQREREL